MISSSSEPRPAVVTACLGTKVNDLKMLHFGGRPQKKKSRPASKEGIIRRFWSPHMGTGRNLMGVTMALLFCLGGEIHDTSSAWELDLLHQGHVLHQETDSC